jgi:cyclophilin family peptidyl-prolyl cis-trans isomerase
MTMLGNFAIPKSGKITATISKPPGTPIGSAAPPPAGSGPTPLPVTAGMGPNGSSAATNGPAADQNKPDPIATIETDKGTIEVRLFRKYAPRTVENFIDLCTRGFYNGLTFHRVEPGFCIQGGDPNGSGTGIFIDPKTHQPRYLQLEVSANLKHNGPGVVAMARSSNQDSASCQFYITLGAQPSLDMQYAVFGGVISGMNVVQSIQKGDKIRSAAVREQD